MNVLKGRFWIAGLYFLVVVLELFGETLVELTGSSLLVFTAKPLMMPVLGLYLFTALGSKGMQTVHRFILAALFLSWLGDLFLMVTWTGVNLFLYGLGAFLVAHLMYINAFRLSAERASYLRSRPVAALPVILYCAGLVYALYRYDNGSFAEMQFPVILYAGVIMVMVLTALNRRNAATGAGFNLVFWGALFFMFSDSLIAVNKFTPSFEDSPILVRVLIMSTYALGQFLIVEGILREQRKL
jgi:uncharacterized membrane protein YhhN